LEFSLEELMNALVQRMETMAMGIEDLRFRINVIGTALTDSEVLDEKIVKAAVSKQLQLMNYLESNSQELIKEETVEKTAKGIYNWFKCDLKAIKKELENYEKMMKQFAQETMAQEKGRIEIASSGLMPDLNKFNKKKM